MGDFAHLNADIDVEVDPSMLVSLQSRPPTLHPLRDRGSDHWACIVRFTIDIETFLYLW